MKTPGIKSLGLDADVHKSIKRYAQGVERQMKEMVKEAWGDYLSKTDRAGKGGGGAEFAMPNANTALSAYETRHQPLHKKLDEILNSGNTDQIKFVTQSVQSSHDIAMQGRSKHKSGN